MWPLIDDIALVLGYFTLACLGLLAMFAAACYSPWGRRNAAKYQQGECHSRQAMLDSLDEEGNWK